MMIHEPSLRVSTTMARVMNATTKSSDRIGIRPSLESTRSDPDEREREDLAGRVRALLHAEPDLRAVDAVSVARMLGLSSRTLSRKLDEQGTTFRALFDEVRKDIALRELRSGALALGAIAERLGFGNAPSFHRAFKRWTGATIGEARRNLQPGSENDSSA